MGADTKITASSKIIPRGTIKGIIAAEINIKE